jgi:lysophospholipase L1-like esterase
VLVHAGHNDAQLSGGDPRVTKGLFRDAAADIDRALASRPAVDRHAFVGLVPLLRVDRPGAVPFGETQPDRSLAYDDILAETVTDHVPVARPVDDWVDRTEDGVHPNETGHAFVAERVAGWLD